MLYVVYVIICTIPDNNNHHKFFENMQRILRNSLSYRIFSCIMRTRV